MGGTGAVEEEGAGVSSVAEVVGTSDLLPLAFLGPLNSLFDHQDSNNSS